MAFDIAEPLTATWLSLPRYAQILGVNPVHFQGATADGIFPVSNNRCEDLWPRYSWQSSDRVSHSELADVIREAEWEIAQVLGYPLVPTWIAQEVHRFPRHYRRDLWKRYARDNRGARVGINTKWGKVISPGQRAIAPIDTATVAGGTLVYSDEDGDGFDETATIKLATTVTDVCEVKLYFADTSAAPGWEIRPLKSVTITGGTVIIVLHSWLLIDPDLQSAYPTTDRFTAIDISTTANFVTSVDVYRIYTDTTTTSAIFYWEPDPPGAFCSICGGTGCTICALATQDGCLHIRDAERGIVVPTPGTYSDDDGAWASTAFSVCRDPDMVKLYYQAGGLSDEWKDGSSCVTLSNLWARTIAMLATARLERPFCSCANVTALAARWRQDLSATGETSTQLSFRDLDNPFGLLFGELAAWRRVSRLTTTGRRMRGIAV